MKLSDDLTIFTPKKWLCRQACNEASTLFQKVAFLFILPVFFWSLSSLERKGVANNREEKFTTKEFLESYEEERRESPSQKSDQKQFERKVLCPKADQMQKVENENFSGKQDRKGTKNTEHKFSYIKKVFYGITVITGISVYIFYKYVGAIPGHIDNVHENLFLKRITYDDSKLNLSEDVIAWINLKDGIDYGAQGELSLAQLENNLLLLAHCEQVKVVVLNFLFSVNEPQKGFSVHIANLCINIEQVIAKRVLACKKINPNQTYIGIAEKFGPKGYYIANRLDRIFLLGKGGMNLHWFTLHPTIFDLLGGGKSREYTSPRPQKEKISVSEDKTELVVGKYKLAGYSSFKEILTDCFLSQYALLERPSLTSSEKSNSLWGTCVSCVKMVLDTKKKIDDTLEDFSFLQKASFLCEVPIDIERAIRENFVNGTYPSKKEFFAYITKTYVNKKLLPPDSKCFAGLRGDAMQGQTKQDVIDVVYIKGSVNEELYYQVLPRLVWVYWNPFVKGVILVIDSPGGYGGYSDPLHNWVKIIAEKKQVIAYTIRKCCSAAYEIASQAHIIASTSSAMIGSIGVRYSLEPGTQVKDSDREKAREIYENFVDTVVEGRCRCHPFNREEYKEEYREMIKSTDAEIYSGKQALNLRLIDHLDWSLADCVTAIQEKVGACRVFHHETLDQSTNEKLAVSLVSLMPLMASGLDYFMGSKVSKIWGS